MTWFPIYADVIVTPLGPTPALIIVGAICVVAVVATVVLVRIFRKSKK